jgi:hypothetical protein
MMSGDITETAINWDHDTGIITVCTRKKAIVSKLRKLGLVPIRDDVAGYTTFRAKESQLKVGLRGPRKMSEDQRKAAGDRLRKSRKAT